MQLNSLPSMNFKGMIILNSGRYKLALNPDTISAISDTGKYGRSKICFTNGLNYVTDTDFKRLTKAIEKANQTDSNIDITA